MNLHDLNLAVAPNGKAFKCPDCGLESTLGTNAAYHVTQTGHRMPEIVTLKPDELNPHHPVTAAASDNWHKLCAILMMKFGQERVEIRMPDMEAVAARKGGCNIVVKESRDKIELFFATDAEARTMAVEAGGIF